MVLPADISPGLVLIYGLGSSQGSINGIVPGENFVFGVISQGWAANIDPYIDGQSVMFNTKDIDCVVVYGGWPYTLIDQNKIKLVEQPAL